MRESCGRSRKEEKEKAERTREEASWEKSEKSDREYVRELCRGFDWWKWPKVHERMSSLHHAPWQCDLLYRLQVVTLRCQKLRGQSQSLATRFRESLPRQEARTLGNKFRNPDAIIGEPALFPRRQTRYRSRLRDRGPKLPIAIVLIVSSYFEFSYRGSLVQGFGVYCDVV